MNYTYGSKPTILIIDDQPGNVEMLEAMLGSSDADLVSTTDAREALPLYEQHRPDLVLLDLMMPHRDGYSLMKSFAEVEPEGYVPILVLTADVSRETKRRALEAGASDFLSKPFDIVEVQLRIRHLLETRFLQQRLRESNLQLEQRILERTKALEASQIEIATRLALAAEYRDDDTGQHTWRVGYLAGLIAPELGLDQAFCQLLMRAARLHDIGKVGISDAILLKPGKLTHEEFEVMKTHTSIGADLLAGGSSTLLRVAERIARGHHERWDGAGYPQGLAGEDISIEGRIVAVADVYDALTHARPYKAAWPRARAAQEILRQGGAQFDPQVVAAFLKLWQAGIVDMIAEQAPRNHSDLGTRTLIPGLTETGIAEALVATLRSDQSFKA